MIGDRRIFFGLDGKIPTEALRKIPGVWVGREKPTVGCPESIVHEVALLLDAAGVTGGRSFHANDLKPPVARYLRPSESPFAVLEALQSFHLYQARAVHQLIRQRGGHVWAAPGAGKTRVYMAVALAFARPTFLITKKDAVLQVADEITELSKLDPFVLRAPSLVRKKHRTFADYLEQCQKREQPPFVIGGWGSLASYADGTRLNIAGSEFYPEMLIFDESQFAKATDRSKWRLAADGSGRLEEIPNGNRSSLAAQLTLGEGRVRLAGTGTAVDNVLEDLWAQLSLVEPGMWGGSAKKYILRYAGGVETEWGVKPSKEGVTWSEEFTKRVRVAAVIVDRAVSHACLPPCERRILRVPAEAFTRGASGLAADIKRASKSRGGAAVLTMAELRLQEACFWKRDAIVEAAIDAKQRGKGKTLIYVGRRAELHALGSRLAKAYPEGCFVYDSEALDDDERRATRLAYMAHPGPCVLIGSYQGMGTAINLQDTDTSIAAQTPLTPGQIEQMEGRSDRHGMTRSVLYLYPLAEGTRDMRIFEIVISKLPAVAAVLAGQSSLGNLREILQDRASAAERVQKSVEEIIAEEWDEWAVDDEDRD